MLKDIDSKMIPKGKLMSFKTEKSDRDIKIEIDSLEN
jgi:hypothetical protein